MKRRSRIGNVIAAISLLATSCGLHSHENPATSTTSAAQPQEFSHLLLKVTVVDGINEGPRNCRGDIAIRGDGTLRNHMLFPDDGLFAPAPRLV